MKSLQLKSALHHAVTPSCNFTYQKGAKVLVLREKSISNRIGEWLGSFFVEDVDCDKKIVFIWDTAQKAARL